MNKVAGSRWRWAARLLAIATIAAVLVALWLAWDREALLARWQNAGPLPFFAAMAILPAFGAPLTPFTIVAGATFGRQLGLIGTWTALAANLALCYALAQLLRPWLATLVARFGYDLPRFSPPKQGAVRFTLAVKAAPGLPAFVKNYGLGVAGVPFAAYFIVSMLITGLYATALVLVGESLLSHRAGRALAVALAALVCAFVLWRRFRRSRAERA
jgi:uncharacterized membrane protein YdjX (TVP38/TMEM64 family)